MGTLLIASAAWPDCALLKPDVTKLGAVSDLILFDVAAVTSRTTYREDTWQSG
jgi:hypothetical protein